MDAQVIGLVAHEGKPGAREFAGHLISRFEAAGRTVLVETRTAALVGRPGTPLPELGGRCDLLVVLGGDGSLLRTVHGVNGSLPPVFGINLGSLGFLTCLSSQDRDHAAEVILSGRYVLSPRSLLEVRIEREDGSAGPTAVGLNEAVLGRGAHSHLVQLDALVDGQFLTRYNADGLIIATPTGSTAYALSAGGPVLAPDAGTFVINPICPHVLTNRATVVPDSARIELRVCPGEEEVLLTVDGRAVAGLTGGDRVWVRKSERTVRLAMPEGTTFYDLLRQKLKWSGTSV